MAKRSLELQRLATVASRGASAFGFCVWAVLVLGGGTLLNLFGASYATGLGAFLVLATGQVFVATFGPVAVFLTMTGHQRQAAMTQAVAVLINVVGNGLLIPWWGLVGAASATVASQAVWKWSMYCSVKRHIGIRSSAFQRPAGS